MDIYYLLNMDCCREAVHGIEPDVRFCSTIAEPRYRNPTGDEAKRGREHVPAMKWAICTATKRGALASDSGSAALALGAFTGHLLSEDCGLFEMNVPLKRAFRLASERVGQDKSTKFQQEPLMLLDNIDDDFCLQAMTKVCGLYDVCVCYRNQTDRPGADFLAGYLKPQFKTFFRPLVGGEERPDIQIARAVCNSKIIIVIVSKRTFHDINTWMNTNTPKEEDAQNLPGLLRQIEMILEIHEHRSESVRVVPVYLGMDEYDHHITRERCLTAVDPS